MKRKHLAIIIIAVLVWIFSIISFWTIFPKTAPFYYVVIIQWMIWPMCIIVISMNAFTISNKMFIVPLLGLGNMLAELFTFLNGEIIINQRIDFFSVGQCIIFFVAGAFIAFVSSEFAKEKKKN